jgi:hypothetical protein
LEIGRRYAEGLVRLAPLIEGEVQPQSAVAQLIHNCRMLHEDNLVPGQCQAAADVGADRACTEREHLQLAVQCIGQFR